MRVSTISFAVACLIAPSNGFLTLPFMAQPDPLLAKYAEAQKSALLKIHLDIGEVDMKNGKPIVTGHRLGIDGLTVNLHGDEDATYQHPKLPGCNGPNPQLSTGAKSMELVKNAKFVDITGSKTVTLEHGVWEMIWRNNAKAGALICGFDVPEEVKRNEASIPKGKMYVTFPVWTSESLQDLRQRKEKAEEKASEASDRLKDETRKMEETSNPLMKALHFRNAMKAHEDIDYSGFRGYKRMNLDRDMINLKNGLHLCSLGTVWTKKDNFFGGEHHLLGSALASKGDLEDMAEKKTVTERHLKSVAFDGLRPFE